MDLFKYEHFKLIAMSYILTPTSVIFIKYHIKSRFGGSSKYKVLDDELIEKPHKKINHISYKQKRNSLREGTNELEDVYGKIAENEKKRYKLNKSKVKKKCFALSRLSKSKKFLAFYSISFPVNLSDQVCYKLFNTWLTRCRKTGGLKTYLWVAERQINGTIHYHLLTNDFMPIKAVNDYMAKSLKTEKRKVNEILKEVKTEIYNGVDVKGVDNNKKSLIGYLIKYVAKNDIEFYRLPWHCSRDVSRLFTSIYFDEPEDKKYFDKLPKIADKSKPEEKYNVLKTEKYNVAGFKFTPDEDLYDELNGTNEVIYKKK